jgi:hypothetical protein
MSLIYIFPPHLKFTPMFTATVKTDCLTKLFSFASAKGCVVQNIDCTSVAFLLLPVGMEREVSSFEAARCMST